MSGRYRLSRRKQIVEDYFDTVPDEPDWTPVILDPDTYDLWLDPGMQDGAGVH